MRGDPVVGLAVPGRELEHRQVGREEAERLVDLVRVARVKKILRGDSRPYVTSPDDLPKLELKEVKINGGLGFYANFVDPDLVGKPVEKGNYKTATPVILSLGSKYLIKVTVLCDEINGADYRDALKIVESIRVKKSD